MINIKEDDDNYLVELENSAGRQYQVVYPKGDDLTLSALENALTQEAPTMLQAPSWNPYQKLYWIPGENSGRVTSEGAKHIGIAEGFVKNDGVLYTYQINFRNTRGFGFEFQDDSGDTYYCKTILNRWHFINYTETSNHNAIITGVREQS